MPGAMKTKGCYAAMMGNFFNRMYYGKSGKEDYTRDDLPDNRWTVFLAMIRLNFGKLVRRTCCSLLFFCRCIFGSDIEHAFTDTIFGKRRQYRCSAVIVQTIYGIAPCLVLMVARVVAEPTLPAIGADENVWVWADFWYAVKSNWKQMLAMSALMAWWIFSMCNRFLWAMLSESMFTWCRVC
jgi:hypothetical protein